MNLRGYFNMHINENTSVSIKDMKFQSLKIKSNKIPIRF